MANNCIVLLSVAPARRLDTDGWGFISSLSTQIIAVSCLSYWKDWRRHCKILLRVTKQREDFQAKQMTSSHHNYSISLSLVANHSLRYSPHWSLRLSSSARWSCSSSACLPTGGQSAGKCLACQGEGTGARLAGVLYGSWAAGRWG